MPRHPQNSPAVTALTEFGQFVLSNQEQITRRWVTVVDRSPEVTASDDLTYQQVLDHLPALCTELGLLLKHPDASSIRDDARRDAGRHGRKRWQQGYKLQELIREICLIRNELVGNWLNVFSRNRASFDTASRDLARQVVQRFFDDLVIESTLQFAEEQGDAIRNLESELTSAKQTVKTVMSDLLQHVSHVLREPLGAISFAAQALQDENNLSKSAKEYVRIILRNVKEEAEHVNELLMASRLQSHAEAKRRDARKS
jgi:signal transduction histidine kinase